MKKKQKKRRSGNNIRDGYASQRECANMVLVKLKGNVIERVIKPSVKSN